MKKLFISFFIAGLFIVVLSAVLYFCTDSIAIRGLFYVMFVLCLCFVIIGIRNPIMIRENLILKKCYDRSFLYCQPGAPGFSLKTDFGNSRLDYFRRALPINIPQGISDFEKTKLLVHLFRSRGEKLGEKMEEKSQESIFDLLLSGTKGGCDDYADILAVLCAAYGIYARNIGLGNIAGGGKISHTMFEIYSKEQERWILFDGLYNAWFEVNGRPCDLLEARDCMLGKKKGVWKICYINGINYHSYKNMENWFKELCPFVYFFTTANHLEREIPKNRYGILYRLIPDFLPFIIKDGISFLFGKYKQAYAYYDELTPDYLTPILKISFYLALVCFPVSILFIILDLLILN